MKVSFLPSLVCLSFAPATTLGEVQAQDVLWQEEEEKTMTEEDWHLLHDKQQPGSPLISLTQQHLRGQVAASHDADKQEASISFQDPSIGKLAAPSRRRLRKLKDKTTEMFDQIMSSSSSSKQPKSCKSSSKSPKSVKAGWGSDGEGILSCTHPSMAPSIHPSFEPSKSLEPSLEPSTSVQPSLTPSQSSEPSMMPSEYVYPGCYGVTIPDVFQCFTGDADSVTKQCQETNSSCCALDASGVASCVDFQGNATVCSGSCIGENACLGLGVDVYIGPNSCVGEEACQYFAAGGTIQAAACHGEYTCASIGREAPTGADVRVESKSCNCYGACAGAGKRVTQGPVWIGFASCKGPESCRLIGNLSPYLKIGSNSCNSDESCNRAYMEYIGDNSCQGQRSCKNMGPASGAGRSIRIGSNSCNPTRACFAFAGRASLPANVTIGDNACNTNASQCSGSSTSGTSECLFGTGMYGINLPDGAVKC